VRRGFAAVTNSVSAHWLALDHQFMHHAKVVDRFRGANGVAVLRMRKRRTNEGGKPLSQFEREALRERFCELFSTWPD
jgi:hypothetical protein